MGLSPLATTFTKVVKYAFVYLAQREKALEKIREEMEKIREEQKEEFAERMRERIQRLREEAERRRHRYQVYSIYRLGACSVLFLQFLKNM